VTTIPLPAAGLRASNGERSWPSLVLCLPGAVVLADPGNGPGPISGRSPESNKTEQDGFVGSGSCLPCHQNIYDKFSKTNMGRSMTRVTPGLLANLVTSAALHDEKLDQHFEVFARDGKLLQSQYAKAAGGSEIFRETHEVQWIIGSGTNASLP